jgi:hypothetical protein
VTIHSNPTLMGLQEFGCGGVHGPFTRIHIYSEGQPDI